MNWRKTAIVAAVAAGTLGAAAYAQPFMQQVHGYQGMMDGWGPGYGMLPGYRMGPGMMGGHAMGRGMMDGYFGYRMGPGAMWGAGGRGLDGIRHLDLSDAQRDQLRGIDDELRRKNWDLMGQMQEEMAKLRDHWSATKTDRDAILAADKRMFELRQQMLRNRIDAQDRAEALLTPQQKEQYDRLA
ncbi:MAG: Spy/CpxP family protein refolding chaperone, partial [Betaproteobacteria bacterium]